MRSSGPVPRSKGRVNSSRASLRMPSSPSGPRRFSHAVTVTSTSPVSATTCTGRPSAPSKVVRSDSWRRTSSAQERRQASRSSRPWTRMAPGML